MDSWQTPLIKVQTTTYGGRGYFALENIPAETALLTLQTPLTSVIYRAFKKEVCAYCFAYNMGRPFKIKLVRPVGVNAKVKVKSQAAAYAGLHFCTDACRGTWVTNYDHQNGLVSETLDCLETAFAISHKSPEPDLQHIEPCLPVSIITPEFLEEAWLQLDAFAASTTPSPSSSPALLPQDITSSTPSLGPTRMAKNQKAKIPYLDDPEFDAAREIALIVILNYMAHYHSPTEPTPEFKSLINNFKGQWEVFQQLQNNELALLHTFPTLVYSHLKVYQFLAQCLPTQLRPYLTRDIVRTSIGKDAGNAFGIWELPQSENSECVGSSIYGLASFFNHACNPNVLRQRVGRQMIFKTKMDIQKGDQLNISYGNLVNLERDQRQKILFDQWHFNCACLKCVQELSQIYV
ncbi:SET domain-containing protein [Nadsonia fulvescens var. elongata DSM 6958]|uniref:SET domain-containing protein n=1 Tax=Nadsonia fulvescens var. elongata DSM 6958 TaxID=857566 RepID=A0A1E3PPE1_9ASCO|nr:SET domain-containing protein [Nadsonia fulvescens var. elongata DSM 6958]